MLLDSGVTHLLRQAKDKNELDRASPVVVTLAGDEGKVLKQLDSGTVLTEPGEEAPQPIIPFGQLIEVLGCKVTWTKGLCKVRHPTMGALKVRLRNGCPEVVCQAQALELVMELEKRLLEKNTKELEARLLSLTIEEDKCWVAFLNDYMKSGSRPVMAPFEDYDKSELAVSWHPDTFNAWNSMKRALPLPRRVRKRLWISESWVIVFTRDKFNKDPIPQADYGDAVVLRVDSEMEKDPVALELIVWAIANGRVSAVIGTEEPQFPRSMACQAWLYVMAKVYGCGLMQAGFLTMTTDHEDLMLNLALPLQVVMELNEVPLGRTTDGREWMGFTDMSEMRVLEGRTGTGGCTTTSKSTSTVPARSFSWSATGQAALAEDLQDFSE